MNPAFVSRTLSLIPDRVPRVQSGSTFDPSARGTCPFPERIAHLAQFLSWLGPLNPITKDDLRLLGFLTAYGKPALLGPEGPDEDAEAAGSADETLIAPESPVAPPEQEATLS
ncbi:MAG TPA: hypothetical protein VEQ87_09795 [Burkholderiales bacterium]|nr:hypothetical protein [Burkholderiales bacterium]